MPKIRGDTGVAVRDIFCRQPFEAVNIVNEQVSKAVSSDGFVAAHKKCLFGEKTHKGADGVIRQTIRAERGR